MLSFHNDPKIKKKYLDRVIAHQKADEIIKGKYWEGGKGCAVGCTIHSSNHNAYEQELGIPEWLAKLEDTIFEGLPNDKAKKWPQEFLKAIKVGVDLEPVKWEFCAFILKENIERVLILKIEDSLKEQVVNSIQECLSVHEEAIISGIWDESAALSARSAALSAALSAAEAARSAAYVKYADELLRILKGINPAKARDEVGTEP